MSEYNLTLLDLVEGDEYRNSSGGKYRCKHGNLQYFCERDSEWLSEIHVCLAMKFKLIEKEPELKTYKLSELNYYRRVCGEVYTMIPGSREDSYCLGGENYTQILIEE